MGLHSSKIWVLRADEYVQFINHEAVSPVIIQPGPCSRRDQSSGDSRQTRASRQAQKQGLSLILARQHNPHAGRRP